MTTFDYVVLGAGSAGCVLANRLSRDPVNRVLLIEAGGHARNPCFFVPKLSGRLLNDQRYAWQYPTLPFGPNHTTETWFRGRVVGGSSAINGMIYNRGSRADYDELERRGNDGWGWDDILPFYLEFENNELGPSQTRGSGGPLHISQARGSDLLCDEIISAGARLGLRRVDDLNERDDPRIGHPMANIRSGRRVSAAKAFLAPALGRPNLQIATGAVAERLVLERGRAAGVVVRSDGQLSEIRARREVVMSLGAFGSPKLLQLSGIGPREVLMAAGVQVYLERADVGRRMREHRCVVNTYRLNENLGDNRHLATLPAKARTVLKYLATGDGPLAVPPGQVMGFFKTQAGLDRVDGQVLVGTWTVGIGARGGSVERLPGISCMGEVLRPTSEGSVWITSPNPASPQMVNPNFLATEYDRTTAANVLRTIRRIFLQSPIADRIAHETAPGLDVQTDDEMTEATLDGGTTGYHAIGTCGMGPGDNTVVDEQLRVRGIEGLRIVDASVIPTMVSGNLNGPVMAMAARAAEMILDDCRAVSRPGAASGRRTRP